MLKDEYSLACLTCMFVIFMITNLLLSSLSACQESHLAKWLPLERVRVGSTKIPHIKSSALSLLVLLQILVAFNLCTRTCKNKGSHPATGKGQRALEEGRCSLSAHGLLAQFLATGAQRYYATFSAEMLLLSLSLSTAEYLKAEPSGDQFTYTGHRIN